MRISNTNYNLLLKTIESKGIELDVFTIEQKPDAVLFTSNIDNLSFSIHKHSERDSLIVRWMSINSFRETEHVTEKFSEVESIFNGWLDGIKSELDAIEKINKPKRSKEHIPMLVAKISPMFETIYKQSFEAEFRGLDLICGLGYRKSFEFLLKDYLIKHRPKEEHDDIKRKQVSDCVKDYVDDVNVKILALRIFWLGNDQAHYVKKHKSKGVEDIKKLIIFAIKWMEKKEELAKMEKQVKKIEQQIKPKR